MIETLPPKFDFDSAVILKQTIRASRALGELKGAIATIPNEKILLDTLILNEAKNSNAVENIITTYDELYRSSIGNESISPSIKEVQNYARALKYGYEIIKDKSLLTVNNIIAIQKINCPNYSDIRKIPGTVLRNETTGKTVYTPPQHYDEIIQLFTNLEKFINDNNFSKLDPLIKMPIIHYQFESIHPFHDGNGRIGRIINILYLTQQGLLTLPVLYLSEYIINHKADYYQLLSAVREEQDWNGWCQWLLNGVEETAINTIDKITKINDIMRRYKNEIREEFPFYSQDLINVLFRYPYTKIDFIENELNVHRNTASHYLDSLVDAKYLDKIKKGRINYYFNMPLCAVLKGGED